MAAVKVPLLCACGKRLRIRASGSGRQPGACAACGRERQAAHMKRHHAERTAALKYCRAMGVDALAWLERQKATSEGCPDCGEPCNNADGRRCGECAAGQEP